MSVGVLLGTGGFGTHLSLGGGGNGGGVIVENGHGGKRTVVSFCVLVHKGGKTWEVPCVRCVEFMVPGGDFN